MYDCECAPIYPPDQCKLQKMLIREIKQGWLRVFNERIGHVESRRKVNKHPKLAHLYKYGSIDDLVIGDTIHTKQVTNGCVLQLLQLFCVGFRQIYHKVQCYNYI